MTYAISVVMRWWCSIYQIDNNKNHVKPQNNFLSIITNQADAYIYIDDNYVGQKEVFKSFPIGR